jgi:outer membrane receptor protein involved in Fe transport
MKTVSSFVRCRLGLRRSQHSALVAAALGLAASALAPGLAQSQAATSAASDDVPEVVVTGSHILRRDLEASSPIMTVDSQAIERISNVGLENVLNRMPQFSPRGTQFDTNANQATATTGPGVSAADLRGLGANRTLVLIDGRRAQPANASLAIDINTIPTAAVKSIEVITGGASSVYGADAIAGVVNFVLRDDFEGLEIDGQSGITQEGDGAESRLSAAIGKNLGGEGNIFLGLEVADRKTAEYAGRDFYEKGWADPGTVGYGLVTQAGYVPGTNRPSASVVNSLFPGQAPGSVSPASTFYFNSDGSPWQTQRAAGYKGPLNTSIKIGPGGNINQSFLDRWASDPLRRYSMFGKANWKINASLTAFAQATFSSVRVQTQYAYVPATNIWSVNVPYRASNPVPSGFATLLNSRPDPTADWSLVRKFDFVAPMGVDARTTAYQMMFGLKGSLPVSDWTWEAYAANGSTHANAALLSSLSFQRYQLLVDSPGYGAGVNLTGAYGQTFKCTSGIPVFGGFEMSADCLEAMTADLNQTTDLDQSVFEANLQGKAFDLPAGEVRFAVGAAYRDDDFRFNPDSLNAPNSIIENPIGLFATAGAKGRTSVQEGYAEMLVPVLKDLPLIRKLDLELGYRSSKYNTEGTGRVGTYKALFNWAPIESLRFRGGYQKANRAPNVAELFQGGTERTTTLATGDPCASNTIAPWGNIASNPNRAKVQALCEAIIGNKTSQYSIGPGGPGNFVGAYGFFTSDNGIVSGNRNLTSESAKTWTAGLVFRSPAENALLRNFTASVDWYSIKITDAIAPTDLLTVYQHCLNSNGLTNPTYSLNDPGGYCSLIHRDPLTGDRMYVATPYLNTGGIKTEGTDVALNWRASLADFGTKLNGRVFADLALTFLDHFQTSPQPGAPFLESVGTLDQTGQYRWRAFSTWGYGIGPVDVSVTWLHLPGARPAQIVAAPTTTVRGVSHYDLFGLQGAWSVTPNFSVRAGVDNLLDKEPLVTDSNPGVNNNYGNTMPGHYDVLGRRFYAGVRLDL